LSTQFSHGRVGQADVYLAATPVGVAGAQRTQDCDHPEQRTRHISHRRVEEARRLTPIAMQHTRRGQVVGVVARGLRQRAGRPVAAEGAIDQAWVDLPQNLVVQAEAAHHAGPEALDQHIVCLD
jgi:hypothetical protein